MTAITSSRAFAPFWRAGAWPRLMFARRDVRGAESAGRVAAAASRPGRPPEAANDQPDVMSPVTAAAPPGTQAQDREDRVRRPRFGGVWPLLAVLAVQAALSLRLVRADTASQSEALYLHAGHLEWAHWLHGVADPAVPVVLLRLAGDLPAARRGGGQPRRAGRAPGCCPWCSCSAPRSCCGVLLPGCSGGGPRSSPPRCSPCWARPCTWGRSPPTTRWRCSWSRWRPGA